MTEAELLATFQNYVLILDTEIFGFISLLTGFIVLSYFVADRFTATLTTIVIVLYSLACGILITRMIFVRNDFEALLTFIVQQKEAGNLELPWFGINPPWAGEIVSYLIWGVTVGGYLGSVAFFFFQRRVNRSDA